MDFVAGRKMPATISENEMSEGTISRTRLKKSKKVAAVDTDGSCTDEGKPSKIKKRKAATNDVISNEVKPDISPKMTIKEALSSNVGGGALTDVSSSINSAHKISQALTQDLVDAGVELPVLQAALNHASKYEALIVLLLAQNERLRGRLDVISKSPNNTPFRAPAAPIAQRLALAPGNVQQVVDQTTFPVLQKPIIQKPEDTWALVVKGGKGLSAKDLVEKVVTEVGPTLRERVHAIKPLRSGGVVIRTPSAAEREKIVSNKKFAEAGLTVSVPDSTAKRVVVKAVDSKISYDEFMGDLFEKNLSTSLTLEDFKASVRIVSQP